MILCSQINRHFEESSCSYASVVEVSMGIFALCDCLLLVCMWKIYEYAKIARVSTVWSYCSLGLHMIHAPLDYPC